MPSPDELPELVDIGNSDFIITHRAGALYQTPALEFNGADGTPGESAYQIWLDQGNVGSEAVFLASLMGTPGSMWYSGAGIPSSFLGVNSDLYLNETLGDVYQKVTGAWVYQTNIRGPQGTPGTDGTPGTNGAPGSVWYTGSGAPGPGLGINGDYYLDGTAGTYYLKSGGTWAAQGSLQGPQGVPGPAGPGGTTVSDISFTGDGSTTSFNLGSNPYYIVVFQGSVFQSSAQYSRVGNNLVFITAPANGVRVTVVKMDAIATMFTSINGLITAGSNVTFTGTGTALDPIVVNATGGGGGGSGTVTSVSVVTANGFSGSVATSTTTPAITIDVTGLDATKIGGGQVSNTEFGYLDGVTSSIQTQINNKASQLDAILAAIIYG